MKEFLSHSVEAFWGKFSYKYLGKPEVTGTITLKKVKQSVNSFNFGFSKRAAVLAKCTGNFVVAGVFRAYVFGFRHGEAAHGVGTWK